MSPLRNEPDEVAAARSVLHKRFFHGGPGFRHMLSDREFGHYCAKWFLESGNNVSVLYYDLRDHGVRITQIFNAEAMRAIFETWLRSGGAGDCDSASSSSSSSSSSFVENVVYIFSLFTQDSAENGIPIRLAAIESDAPIPLQAWLLLEAIRHSRFSLADALVRGKSHMHVAPVAAVVDPDNADDAYASSFSSARSRNYRWVGVVWRNRFDEFLRAREKVGLGPGPEEGKEHMYWEHLLTGNGFREKLEFVVTRLLPALPPSAATLENVLPIIPGKAEDAQTFFRSEFQRFLDFCEGTGKNFCVQILLDYGMFPAKSPRERLFREIDRISNQS